MSASAEQAPLGFDPEVVSQSFIYNNYNLAWDIAHTFQAPMARLHELRDEYAALGEKDPDGTYLMLTEAMKRELGFMAGIISVGYVEPTVITNHQARKAKLDEIEKLVDHVNENSDDMEVKAEDRELEDLLPLISRWTNDQTMEVSGLTRTEWANSGYDRRVEYLVEYAHTHPLVRGLRSRSVLECFFRYLETANQDLPGPLVTVEQFLGDPEEQS